MSVGIVLSFPRTIGIPSAFKRNKFYTVGIFTSALQRTVSAPPHGFTSTDELSSTGIVFHRSKTLCRSTSSN